MSTTRLLLLPFVALIATACGEHKATDLARPADPPPTVNVEVIQPRTLVMTKELPGRIQAVRTAEVRARVSGIIKRRLFEEGSEVRAGQPLYEIEKAPYEIALERTNAAVQRAQAAVTEAQATVGRYIPLADIEAVSQQDLLSAQTTLETAKANLASAVAERNSSKLDLQYATVRAPISGRIDRSRITEGALVGQDEATVLTTIHQIDAVFADVTQAASEILQRRAALPHGAADKAERDEVIVATIEGSERKKRGRLLFSEVAVDPTSGKLTLRGEFKNEDRVLLPGMYVRIAVPQGIYADALTIPQRAVRISSDGKASVWVVNQASKVETRPIKLGTMQENRWHILEGVKKGELVVTDSPDIELGQTVTISKKSPTNHAPAKQAKEI